MGEQGRDVVLHSNHFSAPSRCASCLAPQETTLGAKKRNAMGGGGSLTRTFQIPYCTACANRARMTRVKGWLFTGATFGIAGLFAAIGLAAPGLPIVVLVALPTVLALGFAVLTMTVLAPKAPAAPAMAAGDAVRLVSFGGSVSTLYCVNPQWGEEFARANNVQAVPKSRSAFFGVKSLGAALVFAPLAAGGVWFVAHPQVHIDNAGPDALQIWVDGKPSKVAPSNANGAPPPSIWVARGKHVYGYSKVGAAQPEATIEANTTMMDAHLYNPGKSACYWLVADGYGTASVAGISQGPQPIQEFYSFDKVSTWFGDNPQSVEVSDGKTGDTRVALQRAKACMEMAAHGCDEKARADFISCERDAKGEEAFKKCEMGVACMESKPGASASRTAPPAPHPSAHGGPHTPPAHAAPHAH